MAGSDKYDPNYNYNKIQFNELISINKSLSNLGIVINALSNKKSYIPYRNSKLTQILQNSLNGNAKNFLIATISPSIDSYEESLNTLQFADRAHSILNKIEPNVLGVKNHNLKESHLINKLQKEIADLRAILKLRQRNFPSEIKLRNELIDLKKENTLLKKKISKYELVNINSYKNKNEDSFELDNNKYINNKDNNEKNDNNNNNNNKNKYHHENFYSSLSQNDIFSHQKNYLPPIKLQNHKKSLNNIYSFKNQFNFVSKKIELLEQIRMDNKMKLKKEIDELMKSSKKKKFSKSISSINI